MENGPPKNKREHLQKLIEEKQRWSDPLSDEDRARGFLGWHERGYLPHCDKPGLTQFVTLRLADSMPQSRLREWEHLLAETRSEAPRSGAQNIALREREKRRKLEDYLDCGHGECHLRNAEVATLTEFALRYHHEKSFRLLAWVVMPNHLHVLVEIWDKPCSKFYKTGNPL